ncbi:carbamoyltransferase [Candidatus Pelagibacter bacterium]|nr:carbamoyltransferase [Candidatus Pelagibacter bacterium]MDB2708693.1 carbamoyltransferase [Candidatus Pelagibacter bacterium]
MKIILGISAFYHDSAATILVDGKIIAAAQEERFTRKKHDASYPFNAIEFVLNFAKIKLGDVDQVIFFEKPFLKFERLLETYVAFAPRGFKSFCMAMPVWLKDKLFQKKMLFNELKRHDNNFNDNKKIFFSDHHLSHAASAFFPSPFEEAIVLTADGVGEWATTTVAIGKGNNLEIKKEIHFPHSLGLLYSAFTYYTGFKVNSGEYKLMGLAPYGVPIYEDKIKSNLIDIKEDGSFHLDQSYFNYATGLTMTNKKFDNLFGQKVRNSKNEKLTQFHMDIAASIQKVTEDVMIKLIKSLKKEFNISNLCLAGGVALNCVANGKILKEKIFDNIWVQPAAGDAGGSLGAALALWHIEQNNSRKVDLNDSMQGSYLGPEYSQKDIEEQLDKAGAKYEIFKDQELLDKTATDLSKEEAVGWFQGRMEFGPRALGGRSILGDPRSEKMQKNLNLKVKYRESFRPFAPSILKEDLSEWFDINVDSPYMLMVSNINKNKTIKMTENQKNLFGIDKLNVKRSEIPAVTHVDYSSRIQTVHKETNEKYFRLIEKFKDKTNCPILVNTSFNVRGEPIVNTPLDAFNCFMGTDLDKLVIGNCYLDKNNQNPALKKDYTKEFELD